ncbi:hypothetical protein FPSE_06979 [Fusarium pseudograminearum CS3096]|uniref:C2H2-type domain-containing protein n=1 Tax=Fusarium pseudograminearum (strain CS3096) TaxID=1028729 RepID=K3VIG0_FUSPC|nr:hypothetical protein FPSE_06979 [Fusarium pseudograminearum CS3096]EKJ72933.1 hypothetical protein FPSE_06979 [Fusarium pseudograminearum CS3096]
MQDKVCVNKKQLKNHVRIKHRRPAKNTTLAAQPQQPDKAKQAPVAGFHCTPCRKTFKTQHGLQRHTGDKHGPATNKCAICNEGFRFRSSLEQHQREKHTTETTPPEACQPDQSGPADDSDDSFDSAAYESEPLSDDGEAMRLPEHGEPITGLVRCVGRVLGCREKFNLASEMLYHIEHSQCGRMWKASMSPQLMEEMGEEGRRLIKGGWSYRCYKCKNEEDRNTIMELHSLFEHAESGKCDLKVRTGPLVDVHNALLKYALDEKTKDDRIYNAKKWPGPEYDYHDGLHWPEHGETVHMRIKCLGIDLGCDRAFNSASQMLRHVEFEKCEGSPSFSPYGRWPLQVLRVQGKT